MSPRRRQDDPGSWHHVINRAIAKRPLFEDRKDIRYFLSRLAWEVRRGRLEVHAWCILTTHFHLLVRSPKGDLSEAMRRSQNDYSRFFNRRHRRDGTLVRGRFFSKPVQSLAYRLALVRYIDANSMKAGLAKAPWSYPWGSAMQYVHLAGPPWLERSWIEEHVVSCRGRKTYRGRDYADVFGQALAPGVERLVEHRIEHALNGPDPLDDLIQAAPARVRGWLQRKARIADGCAIGIPVCDATSIRDAIEHDRVTVAGRWEVSINSRQRDGWQLAEVGLLRSLSSLTWEEVARMTSSSISSCQRRFGLHTACIESEPSYADRVVELGRSALLRCHRPTSG